MLTGNLLLLRQISLDYFYHHQDFVYTRADKNLFVTKHQLYTLASNRRYACSCCNTAKEKRERAADSWKQTSILDCLFKLGPLLCKSSLSNDQILPVSMHLSIAAVEDFPSGLTSRNLHFLFFLKGKFRGCLRFQLSHNILATEEEAKYPLPEIILNFKVFQ